MGELKLSCKLTAENQMGPVFTKDKEYKARDTGNGLMVWDNFGCIRHFHGEWQKDKLFKNMFKVIEEVAQDGPDSVRAEGDSTDE